MLSKEESLLHVVLVEVNSHSPKRVILSKEKLLPELPSFPQRLSVSVYGLPVFCSECVGEKLLTLTTQHGKAYV